MLAESDWDGGSEAPPAGRGGARQPAGLGGKRPNRMGRRAESRRNGKPTEWIDMVRRVWSEVSFSFYLVINI